MFQKLFYFWKQKTSTEIEKLHLLCEEDADAMKVVKYVKKIEMQKIQ